MRWGRGVLVCASLWLLLAELHGLEISYAENFKVVSSNELLTLQVLQSWAEEETEAHDLELPFSSSDTADKRIIVGTTTLLPLFVELGLVGNIVGIADFNDVHTPEVLERIKTGELKEVGRGPSLNIETVLALKADYIFVSALGKSAKEAYPHFARYHLPLVLTASYMEATPLARAEWIKFVGLIFGKEKEAETIFNKIEARYNELKSKAATAEQRPTCFVNVPWGAVWYVPGGKSYKAALLKDAGAEYVWEANESLRSLPLGLESVYAKAHLAEYWLDVKGDRINDLMALDSRYGKFKAVQRGNVYSNEVSEDDVSGYDYWERGALHVEEVLADMLHIFHPELLPEHRLIYYRKLHHE